MIQLVIFIVLIAFETIHGKPPEGFMASDVCRAMSSNKYRLQCESIIRDGHFSSLAIKACLTHRPSDNYSRKACMGSIKNKSFTQSAIDACLLKKKHLLNKCLSLSGTPFENEAPPEDAPSSTTP